MLKSLAVKYWPIILLFAAIVAILAMSRYAETSKSDKGENANTVNQTAAVATKANQGKAEDNKSQNSPSWIENFTWPDGVTTWALILTLFVIAWQSTETRAAAKATEEAVIEARASRTLAENTAKRQLRAYLTISSARLFLYQDGSVEPRLVITNSGQTPAYRLRGIQAVGVDRRPLKTISPLPSDELVNCGDFGKDYHLTGQKRRLSDMDMTTVLSHQDIFRLIEDNFKFLIVLHGWYTYRDIFGETHPLNFRLVAGEGGVFYRDSDAKNEWLALLDDPERTEAEKTNRQH